MINNRHKYRFYVDDVRIYLVYDAKYSLKYEKEDKRVFFRVRPNGKLKADRNAFNAIWAQDLDHQFTLRIDRHIGDGVYQTYVTAKFYKTDCFIDEDLRIAEISVKAVDLYEPIISALDKEYDLIKEVLAPLYTVAYKKQPLLQIAFEFYPDMLNMIGDTHWFIEIGELSAATLESFGFATADEVYGFIPGAGDMSPDVSGIYEKIGTFNGADHFQSFSGIYGIKLISVGVNFQWVIYLVSTDAPVYELAVSLGLFSGSANHAFDGSATFDSVSTASQCKFFQIQSYQRMLTDLDTVGGNATLAVPDPDIGGYINGYDFMLDPQFYANEVLYPALFVGIQPYGTHTTTPTEFGRFADDALHFAGEYFNPDLTLPPADTTRAYPLFQQAWQEYSMVFSRTASQTGLLTSAASDETLQHAYRLDEVLGKLLQLIDPTLSWAADASHSSFLFSGTNPLTSDVQTHRYFITPKSNIVRQGYNGAATKSVIKLGQIIDELMPFVWQLYWWITPGSMFSLEHIRYFTRGRSYTADVISEDLTVQIVPRSQKPWAFMTKKYGYRKQNMPEEYNYSWMDEVSEPFRGFPIKMLSNFVEKGLKEPRRISVFTSDIDYIQAVPDRVSLDGFVILAAELVADVWTVPFTAVAVTGQPTVTLQNGLLSMWYLHEKFHKHNLPSEDIDVNNNTATAESTTRAKEQSVVMPSPMEPDPMRLITTSIGIGQVDSMEVNFETRRCDLIVLHDLDFDNPAN